MALIPSGVAALPIPSIFATKFMEILPNAGCPFGISGNIWPSAGDNVELIFPTKPLFSAIFIMPSHKHIIPVNPRDILNASAALVATELATAFKFPEKSPTITEPTTRNNHIAFIISRSCPVMRRGACEKRIYRTNVPEPNRPAFSSIQPLFPSFFP